MSHPYFNIPHDELMQIRTFEKNATPIIRACMVPLQRLMDGAQFSESGFTNLVGDGYLREQGMDTNPTHARAHNTRLSQKRELLYKNLSVVLQAATENNYKPIVDNVFSQMAVNVYQKQMVAHLAEEQDATLLYDFLSYPYRSMVSESGKGLVLRDMGFNGITTYKGADGQPVEAALINDPMKELITRDTPNTLAPHFARMCQLVRG